MLKSVCSLRLLSGSTRYRRFGRCDSLSDPHVVSPVDLGLSLPGAGPSLALAVSWVSFMWFDFFSLAQNQGFQGS